MTLEQIGGAGLMLLFLADIFLTVLYARAPNLPFDAAQTDALYRRSYANLRGAELLRVDDAWHFVMFDQPARFTAELSRFLG